MAKRINMTRERMIALPTLLEIADAYLTTNEGSLDAKDERRYRMALAAFKDN